MINLDIDPVGERYLADVRWVQDDILKLPADYPRYDPATCEVFADHIADRKWSPEERKELLANLGRVGKILQGPFYLGDGIVVGGFWDKRESSRQTLGRAFPVSVEGARVLEIGSMSGYDSFFMNLRRPEYYLSIDPSGYHYQAMLLNEIYRTKIDFSRRFWQDLGSTYDETFDYILNCGCLYHESDIVAMIKRTAETLRLGGTMILATVVVREKQHSDFIKYMPDVYAGDMTYWFAIGEKALGRLFASFGCSVEPLWEAGAPGDTGEGKTIEGYPLEKYNYYKVVKQERKSRTLHTIPRY